MVFKKSNDTVSWNVKSQNEMKKEVGHSTRYIETIKKVQKVTKFCNTCNVDICYAKWIILIVVQIAISAHVFMTISGEVNGQIQFQVTPTSQQMETYATIKAYRHNLIDARSIEIDPWLAIFPITLTKSNGKTVGEFSVSGKAKYLSPENDLDFQKHSMDGYNGPMTISANYINSKFSISLGKQYNVKINDITNIVELGPEFYTCVTLEVHTLDAIYNVEITDGCMFFKFLIQRWAIKSRQYPADFPYTKPEEAKGTNYFSISFHREQPCHFSVEYRYMQGLVVKHSVPVKALTYEPSLVSTGYKNIKYMDVIGESFDGIHFRTKNRHSYKIQQSLKYYQETNKLYPLKMKIVVDYETRDIDGSKIDNDMWLDGANFKYDVTSKNCSLIDSNSKLLLKKNSVKFVVDGDAIKIHVVNKNSIFAKNNVQIFAAEKYGVLIENDAEKCGILDVNQN